MTLFRNENVHSSGAVGIALTGERPPNSNIEFPSLRSITPPLTVTRSAITRSRSVSSTILTPDCRSEGNLINELDGGNPSKLLVAAIQKYGIEDNGSFRDDSFYLGAFRGDKVSTHTTPYIPISVFTSIQLRQMYHIISGDPSRGTIALESHAAPAEGTKIQACSP